MTLGCGSFLGFLFMKGGDPDLFKKVCNALLLIIGELVAVQRWPQ